MADPTAAPVPPPADRFESVHVLEAWDETPTLHGLRVDLGPLGAEHLVPGQVVKLRTPSGVGYFALASAPSKAGHAELLLKRGAKVADEAIEQAGRTGAVDVTAPFGRGFAVGPATGRDVLLFAAGSGIAPVRALVQHFLAEGVDGRRVALFYGQRESRDFAFAREHAAWMKAGLLLHLCSSKPDDGFTGARGYVQDVARELAFGQIVPADAVAYLCGMKGMVAAVREALIAAGASPERIFLNF